jgi:hypothetical protein
MTGYIPGIGAHAVRPYAWSKTPLSPLDSPVQRRRGIAPPESGNLLPIRRPPYHDFSTTRRWDSPKARSGVFSMK